MSGRSFQFGGYGGGGINQPDIPSSAHYDRGTTNYRTPEGKAARTLAGLLDKMSFDTSSFAYLLAVEGGNEMRRRILGIAIGIIKHYASQWEHGVYQDDVARDAMRLKDTLDQFKM